jgi:hypothetical protein
MLASIVDAGALLQVVWLSFAATLLVVACFTAGTVLTARGRGTGAVLGSVAYSREPPRSCSACDVHDQVSQPRSSGRPRASGGIDRPTTPATTISVSR